jgi:hypothetical protein
MTNSVPSRTIRFAGLMSRWARPTSHIRSDDVEPLVDDGVVDVGLADLRAPSKNSLTMQVLPLGVISTMPSGWRHGQSRVGHDAQDVVLVLTSRRTLWKGCLVLEAGRTAECRPSLYQRSERTCVAA